MRSFEKNACSVLLCSFAFFYVLYKRKRSFLGLFISIYQLYLYIVSHSQFIVIVIVTVTVTVMVMVIIVIVILRVS